MKIITFIIPSNKSNMLCDCMVEIIPGLVITGISLYEGKYGRFIKGPSIKLENGKHKDLVKFEGKLKEDLFTLINEAYLRIKRGDEVNFKVLYY